MTQLRTSLRMTLALMLLAWVTGGCVDKLDITPKDVTVSMAMSLQNSGSSQGTATKMPTTVVQKNGNFHGIEQVFVVPFNTPVPSGSDEARAVIAQDQRLGGRNVNLNNQGIASNGLVANNNSHLFEKASIPSTLNRVLVYGKSIDESVSGATASDKAWKHYNGVLTPSNLDNPSGSDDISFSLEQILSSDDSTAVFQKADQAIAKLNAVADAILLTGESSFNSVFNYAKGQIFACSYRTLSSIRDNVQSAIFGYSGPYITEILTAVDDFDAILDGPSGIGNTFPSRYGIPEGVIGMWWNGRDFIRLINSVNIALVPVQGYCYPPSLWYFTNSPIRTSDDESVKEEYKPANPDWNTILGKYDPTGKTVMSSTVSVAVVNSLQYGVGMLSLRLGGCNVNDVIDCKLTGIIVGDQKDVDFGFSPKTSASRYVYDAIENGPALSSGASASEVTTLLLQTGNNQKVHFALEFENKANVISCQQGKILPHCKFYLAGVLDPAEKDMPTVFTQDHITSVTVTIASLDNAYNTVPDLHDPQLEIGIEAEMKWVQVTPLSVKLNL